MRFTPLFLPLIALAAPAAAQPERDAAIERDIARALPSPGELAATGDLLTRIVGAMLDVEIGGVMQAIDPAARPRPGETLGDLARGDDPDFEERMERSVGATIANMDDVMADVAILAPRLLRSLDDFSRDIEDATRDLPRRR